MHAAWVRAIPPVSHHIPPGVEAMRLEPWQPYAVKAVFWPVGAFGETLSMPNAEIAIIIERDLLPIAQRTHLIAVSQGDVLAEIRPYVPQAQLPALRGS